MVVVRMVAIVAMSAIIIRRPGIWPVVIMPHCCVATIVDLDILTVVHIDIDIVIALAVIDVDFIATVIVAANLIIVANLIVVADGFIS